jgi:hypothetical protein
MSQLDELSGDTTMATNAHVATITRHSDQATPSNSPTSQEGRL